MTAPDQTEQTPPLLTQEDLGHIRTVMACFGASACQEMKLTVRGLTLELSRGGAAGTAAPAAPVAAAMPVAGPVEAPVSGGHVIEAASHGMFYLTPSEGAAPFVSVGQTIAEGDRIGLLEAMKVFVEVYSDAAGVVAEILVDNGTEVAPGTPLIRIGG